MDFEDYKEWFLHTFEVTEIVEILGLTAEEILEEFDHTFQMHWQENKDGIG